MKESFRKIDAYGINTIEVNGTLLYTFKIRVCNNETNRNLIRKYFKNHRGVNTDSQYIVLEKVFLDKELFDAVTRVLGFLLKDIAQANLERKYKWTQASLSF